ncbi:hypothetical protein GC088_09990 [Arthrobacter sp. JZ12]|uniref:NACHT domain-containing protein n=1 Tax=Arthrobacter sp. JZ12 TaxID=2654190 RepID=UPI002B469A4C|nr:hypothetical protein [Arthrobacter sp. JZ12]WRH25358.1 hypothetical protein GC088_09990 [Arthrobacter sp. JZ12]
MVEYDLVRLGNKEFEDLAVALCNAEFGPGGQTFGTGRDGGREWTYSGNLQMPALPLGESDAPTQPSGHWDGYTVVQAKHKERLAGGGEDQEWLLSEIQKEVNAWTREEKPRHPKPKNFLVITNVRLSAVQEVGGVDRVTEKMNEHAKTMGLAGWSVWHAAHVSRLLDNYPGIRQTYLGLIVTGDILRAILDTTKSTNPEAAETLTGFVAKELRTYSHIRLTKAGNSPDQESLADIGIDLPAIDIADPTDEDGKVVNHFIASTVIGDGDHPKSLRSQNFATILIGGPGQGKSTIGQLICQAYRVAILEGRSSELTLEHRQILQDTASHLKEIDVPIPRMHRWPIYIRLTEYSEKVLGAEDFSLLKFITEMINARGGPYKVVQSNLASWLREWPWLLVLDGLDEVPDAFTRKTLLEKISDFAADAAELNADVAILATTRRQGYNDDLRVLVPREYELVDLTVKQALRYGRQLIDSRHRGDPNFADEIDKRLKAASQDVMTSKLLGSPLQVSIMASLLEESVRPPRTRHALFSAFYETIFKRESNKLGSIGRDVLEHKSNIDALHDSAGMLLHMEGEQSGRADVHLSRDDLKKISVAHLMHQTYSTDDADQITQKLIALATDRFILLVESSPDKWGFEVRSFQEFMASRYLINGPEPAILERLRILSKSSHWRNTWLFAAAQLFGDRAHLRNDILAMVTGSGSSSMAEHLVKPGAVLAGEMLLENFAGDTPGIHSQLLNQVLELVDTPLLNRNLVPILHKATEKDSVYRRKMEERMKTALQLGGAKGYYAESLMRYWGRRFTGAIPTFIRSKVSIGKNWSARERGVDIEDRRWSVEKDESGVTRTLSMADVYGSVSRADLSSDDEVTFGAFLKSASDAKLIMGADEGGDYTMHGYISMEVHPGVLSRLVKSDAICTALADANDSLPASEAVASRWLLNQIAQALGQEQVGQKIEQFGSLGQELWPWTTKQE